VIDIHKGTIAVNSEFGKGTTFTIGMEYIDRDVEEAANGQPTIQER
jgi:signal transduction histidine kinase